MDQFKTIASTEQPNFNDQGVSDLQELSDLQLLMVGGGIGETTV
jgi:hypothetical protein